MGKIPIKNSKMSINVKLHVDYWRKNADEKWKTAKSLMDSKRYADCLFFCHLTLECLLKGFVVLKTKKIPPFIHNLNVLSNKTGLKHDQEREKNFRVITTFNMTNRYPDQKFDFYKRIDAKFAQEWFGISNKLRLWLLKKYQKKIV